MNVEQSFPIEAETPVRRSAFTIWLKKRRWFVLFVIVPTLLAAAYYGLFASDIYISEARFVIKSPEQKRPQISSLANLIQTTGLSSGQEQANEVLDFVRSRDALKDLEKKISRASNIIEYLHIHTNIYIKCGRSTFSARSRV